MAKILLLEDNCELVEQMSNWLKQEHHIVECALTGESALEILAVSEFDLLVFDWELPGISGVQVLKELRERGISTPILMLTGRSDIADKEHGFLSGADNYLTKPIDLRELSMHVMALTRRRETVDYSTALRTRSLKLDSRAHSVLKNEQEVKLQPQEFALLEFLMRHAEQPFDAETLIARVWPTDSTITTEGVRVSITRVRSKLDEPGKPSIIKTQRKYGYQINPDF